jgi:hypothetical protein
MMFVDPATRQAVLNRDVAGAVRDGSVYRLGLPNDIGIANTSIVFRGQHWSMVAWPLPNDRVRREVLLMHESYHSIQPVLGLQGSGGLGGNAELDTEAGRIWLRAELAALRGALQSSGAKRRQAIADALLFRMYRCSLRSQAFAEEQDLELNEGLAESTGIDASQRSVKARISAALADIDMVEGDASFVRSFPYATGPAYAELLDAMTPDWRFSVTKSFSFPVATSGAYHVAIPVASKELAMAAIGRYEDGRILAQEDAHARLVAGRNARFTRMLVRGPTLTLPLRQFSISFNPQQVYSLPGAGSVYQTLKITDAWGVLTVEYPGMALIPSQFKSVTVALQGAPDGSHLTGQGWSLRLNPGYRLQRTGAHDGSFTVSRNQRMK